MEVLVSVIIPAYNAGKTIVGCLDSVRKQTYRNFEIIVVNDGSKDDTLVILRSYAEAHIGLNLHIHTISNSGPASARNYGIAHANGIYIAFLDSDDQWVLEKLEKQLACFEAYPEIDMLGCDYSIGIKKTLATVDTRIKRISKYQLLLKNSFSTPCVMIKSEVLHKMKFEDKQKYSEDYFLWLQVTCNGYICALQKERLTVLYDKPTYGQSGLSGKLWEMEKGELMNYTQLYKKELISFLWYVIAIGFSLIKYCKRITLTLIRKF